MLSLHGCARFACSLGGSWGGWGGVVGVVGMVGMGWLGWWVSLRLHFSGVHFATGCAWNAQVRPSIYIYIYIYIYITALFLCYDLL